MGEVVNQTLRYFRAPGNYFWRWEENGTVIEWRNGSTIAYRDEVASLLKELTEEGLPPMGTVLLTLAACQQDWKESTRGTAILHGLLLSLREDPLVPNNELLDYVREGITFMDIIHSLPPELRTGPRKTHLIREIFEGCVPSVDADLSRQIVGELQSGRVDNVVFTDGGKTDRSRFKADLEYLREALKRFPTREKLELRVRTGLEKVPAATIPLPEPPPLDLLGQLGGDPQTAGIARLTQHLIAALNIHMHTQGTSDQPFGGVSDITNRGNFDRLLLSELAQDDLLLTARLVNNEALYLRREEPPDELSRERIILIDSTIRMWGLPRVFALAAALACTFKIRKNDRLKAFALSGDTYEEVDLSTKEGVIDALGSLNAALHCAEALKQFFHKNRERQADYIFISDGEALQLPGVQVMLSEVREHLNFLIAVHRTGALHYYEFTNGKRRLLSTSQFHLEELLFSPRSLPTSPNDESKPAFLKEERSPLYFPTAALRIINAMGFYDAEKGYIGVTENHRLLYWPDREKGATELLHSIEQGTYYYFSFYGKNHFFVLVNTSHVGRFYRIDAANDTVDITTSLLPEIKDILDVIFQSHHFLVRTNTEIITLDCLSGKITERTGYTDIPSAFQKNQGVFKVRNLSGAKRHINNGYSALQRVENLYINIGGKLTIDKHIMETSDNDTIRLADRIRQKKEPVKVKALEPEVVDLIPGSKIKFFRMRWPDGSEAIVDSRGFLHLRSSDTSIPEMTIVLVIGKALGGWASDGTLWGSSYFTGMHTSKTMPAHDFYKNYIQRYIDKLI